MFVCLYRTFNEQTQNIFLCYLLRKTRIKSDLFCNVRVSFPFCSIQARDIHWRRETRNNTKSKTGQDRTEYNRTKSDKFNYCYYYYYLFLVCIFVSGFSNSSWFLYIGSKVFLVMFSVMFLSFLKDFAGLRKTCKIYGRCWILRFVFVFL